MARARVMLGGADSSRADSSSRRNVSHDGPGAVGVGTEGTRVRNDSNQRRSFSVQPFAKDVRRSTAARSIELPAVTANRNITATDGRGNGGHMANRLP